LLGKTEALLNVWTPRLEDLVVREEIQRLHKQVYGAPPRTVESYSKEQRYPGGERHQFAMAKARLGKLGEKKEFTVAEPNRKALDRLAGEVPFLREWRQDRSALQSLLKEGEASYRSRRKIYRGVEKLSQIDAYFGAWGRPRPYHAVEVQEAFVAQKIVKTFPPVPMEFGIGTTSDLHRPTIKGKALGESEEVPLGESLLYHWAHSPKRLLPFLIQDPGRLAGGQQVTLSIFHGLNLEIGKDLNRVYGNVRRKVQLAARPTQKYSALRLRLTVANLLPPDSFRVDWNDLAIHVYTPDEVFNRWTYIISDVPEFVAEVDLPPGAWRAGENILVVRVVSLPGLNHRQGADLVRLDLVAEGG
jgi:hypothetical protein